MSTYTITANRWDHNGSFHVEVEHSGVNVRSVLLSPSPQSIRKARDIARRVDRMGKVKWTRLDKITHGGPGAVRYHFTVSRLPQDCK